MERAHILRVEPELFKSSQGHQLWPWARIIIAELFFIFGSGLCQAFSIFNSAHYIKTWKHSRFLFLLGKGWSKPTPPSIAFAFIICKSSIEARGFESKLRLAPSLPMTWLLSYERWSILVMMAAHSMPVSFASTTFLRKHFDVLARKIEINKKSLLALYFPLWWWHLERRRYTREV